MKTFPILSILLAIFMTSCASKKDDAYEVREFDKTYKVVEASANVYPEWIDNPNKFAKDDFRVFISDAQNKNQRLCLKSAEVRASAKIASEISQFIKNTYGESTQSTEAEVDEYMEESLAQEAQAFIVGAQVERTYWEKRNYEKSLAAVEDLSIYQCFVMVKMNKKNLETAIKNATAKLYTSISNPEVKQKTQKILEDVATKFNEI